MIEFGKFGREGGGGGEIGAEFFFKAPIAFASRLLVSSFYTRNPSRLLARCRFESIEGL